MKRIKVALIDSGVDINHSDLYDKSIKSVEIVHKDDKFSIKNCYYDSNGHGTAIAGIIFDKCKNLDLISIKIFDKSLRCSFDVLCKALEYAIKENVEIINLSLGTTEKKNEEKLYNLCEIAINKGIYIVSAFHNKKTKSYPAMFEKVLGVRSKKINYKYGYVYNSDTNQVFANGAKQRVCWINNSYRYVEGNSFACAHFTGILSNLSFQSLTTSWKNLRKELIKNTLSNHQYEEIRRDERKWMKRTLYFPLTRENLNIIRNFDDNKYYKLSGIYDPRLLHWNYYKIEGRSGLCNIKIYYNIEKGLQNSDTLLIGDLSFIPTSQQIKIKRELIEKAILFKKNILCKDSIIMDIYGDLYELAERKNLIMESLYL